MLKRSWLALCVLSIGAEALAAAAPNLSVSVSPPSGIHYYETGRYTFTVANIGNKNASNVSLVIDLPPTHTSPQVYVLGTLGAVDPRCTANGTRLTCALSTIVKFTSKTVYFDIVMPYSTAPLVITGTASTTTQPETNPSNNSATHTASLLSYNLAVNGPVNAHNRHCTGTGLTSFFECELFPSSISSHDIVLNADNTVTIVGEPGYTGTWWQAAPDRLQFEYVEIGFGVVATFDGRGVGGPCFEGPTTFPSGPYMSMYEVCLQ